MTPEELRDRVLDGLSRTRAAATVAAPPRLTRIDALMAAHQPHLEEMARLEGEQAECRRRLRILREDLHDWDHGDLEDD
jgi:hypothetical protein